MNKEVTGCLDCPLLYVSEEGQLGPYECHHPEGGSITIKQNRYYNPVTPDDCPLKKESITIYLKTIPTQ